MSYLPLTKGHFVCLQFIVKYGKSVTVQKGTYRDQSPW